MWTKTNTIGDLTCKVDHDDNVLLGAEDTNERDEIVAKGLSELDELILLLIQARDFITRIR